MPRRVCVFTSTRADWGLLSRLAGEIAGDPDLALQLLVSGTHLEAAFGSTVREIVADGFAPTLEVPISGGFPDTEAGVCQAMGLALDRYGAALQALRPDLLVLLGDRYETFCMAAAAQVSRIPVAHIHGGETTEGAVDEAFRHSITKLSHLHFPVCEAYRRRILQLGEDPARVHNVGALGAENILHAPLLSLEALEASLGFPLRPSFLLVTWHPVTLEEDSGAGQLDELLAALEGLPGHRLLFTGANADAGGGGLNARLQAFASASPRRNFVASLGPAYLSAMAHCAAVVGNSSSGILETPALRKPAVDIGDRQKGRLRAANVIHCGPDRAGISGALATAVSEAFLASLEGMENPYAQPGTARRIAAVLREAPLEGLLKKRFHAFPPDA